MFIEKLVSLIVDNAKMPKVQVERAISPVLEIFIESVMNELAKGKVIKEGEYKLIAPEFPINNEEDNNSRSVNIDFLLYNESGKSLIFLELKTNSVGFDIKQFKRYKDAVRDKDKLYAFLCNLKNPKYKRYTTQVNKKLSNLGIPEFKGVNNIDIIYLAPKRMKDRKWSSENKSAIEEIGKMGHIITFEDLDKYNNIEHEFKNEWKIITEILRKLDNN